MDVLVRYVPAVQALQHGRADVTQAQALLTGDLAHLDHARVVRADALLADAEQDFGARSAVLADGWIGGVLSNLPFIGGQVNAARLLRTAGEDGTVAGTNVVGLVEHLVPNGSNEQIPLVQRLVGVATNQSADLSVLSSQLAKLQADVAALPDGWLFGPLDAARTTLRTQGPKVLATAAPAIALLQALPAAIGPGQHTYLLLLENPGEMRPGGGFIGAVGQVTFTDGAVSGQIFRDSTFSDQLVTNIPAPRPLRTYPPNNQPQHLDEADWSPDFPSAALLAERIYTQATGVRLDGVIGVDPVALGGILSITGPVSVPPYPQVITGANALTELNYIVNHVRTGDPGKVYLPPFGQAVVGRLLHASIGETPAIANSLARSAAQKHIVMYFGNPQLQTLVRGARFDGSVHAPLGDSLEVLDSNMSGSKGDLHVTRRFRLQTTVGADGVVHDQLTLAYHNPPPATAADALLNNSDGEQYRDYIQVLIPETGQLDGVTLSSNGSPATQVAPEAVTYDLHVMDVAYWLVVPRAGSATVTLNYEGPFADISRQPIAYSLHWQRQNSALTWPIEFSAALPGRPTQSWATDSSVDHSWSLLGG